MTDRTRLILLIVTAPIVTYALVGGLLGRASALEGTYQHLRVFEDVVSLISNNYVEPVEAERVMEGALWGLAEGLDPDSSYLTEEEAQLYSDAAAGSGGDVGIGVTLTRRYYVQVVAARDGSPAALAGLRPGDFLRTIESIPTRMMSTVQAAHLLRGAPGTTVTLSVIRGNAAEPADLQVTRGADRSANLASRIVAPGVGYLRIAEFDDTIAGAIENAAGALAQQGAERLLIDLRGTASGVFEAGVAAAALFTDADPLVIRETASGQDPLGATAGAASIAWPLVLMTNYGTSGAAELFAAALTGAGRAESVGTNTAGRAAEQTFVDLPGGGGLLLSSTRYLTASGEPIHLAGLEPAVIAQEPGVELGQTVADPDGDPVLDTALAHLTAMPAV